MQRGLHTILTATPDIAGLETIAESLQDYQRGLPGYEGYLNDKVAPLPELLRDAGYYTILSGKWHLGLQREHWPCKRGFDRQALRKGSWKAVLIPPPHGSGSWQLYDLDRDPGETEDLAQREPEMLRELMGHWDEYVKEVGVVGEAPKYGVSKVDE